MTLLGIHFARPLFLAVGLGVTAALLLLARRLERRRRRALAAFGARGTALASTLSPGRRRLKRGLAIAGMALVCVALARPQRGVRWQEARQRGVDLLFAIDTSKSMRATDVRPSRLARAKLAVRDLTDHFPGDRLGLVAFAGDAFLQCPLTLDRAIFDESLDALDTDIIARGGTDLGRAIAVGAQALASEAGNQKLMVLISDGEDLEGGAQAAARAAAARGVRIFTIGVGTAAGELVPLDAAGHVAHDPDGRIVRSRLDEAGLQALAQATGGAYRPLGSDGRGLEALYRDVLARLPRATLRSKLQAVPIERYRWPLGVALLCLALEPLVGERRRRARPAAATGAAAAAALLLLAAAAHASPGSAEAAYRAGRFDRAEDDYRRAAAAAPDDARLQLNLGASAYKRGDLETAEQSFERALHSDRVPLQARAYYDLGNTRYRSGERTLDKEPQRTIERWKQSLAAYDAALGIDKQDADARFNRDLVARRLAELEKQQQQKQQNQAQNQQQKQHQNQKQQRQSGQQQAQQNGQQQKRQPQSGQQQARQSGQQQKQQQGGGQQQAQQNGQQQQHGAPPTQGPKGQSQQPQQARAGEGLQAQERAQPAAGAAGERDSDTRADAARPGQLSRRDAEMLLDAARADERLAGARLQRGPARPDDDTARKDW